MNKIVREHYPVSKLPDDLQREFEGFESVTLVGEDRSPASAAKSGGSPYHDYDEMMASIKPMTWKELYADMQANPGNYSRGVTIEEAVSRVRALRDEWDRDR